MFESYRRARTSFSRAVSRFISASAGMHGVLLVVLMLSPIVPHITHSLWHALGHGQAVIECVWPDVDESALVQESVELVAANDLLRVVEVPRGLVAVATDHVGPLGEGAGVGGRFRYFPFRRTGSLKAQCLTSPWPPCMTTHRTSSYVLE